jgi:drug/metabolite transporter (DMT)-like permease
MLAQRRLIMGLLLVAFGSVIASLAISHDLENVTNVLGIVAILLLSGALANRGQQSQSPRLFLCGALACGSASLALKLGFPQGDALARVLSVLASALVVAISMYSLTTDQL